MKHKKATWLVESVEEGVRRQYSHRECALYMVVKQRSDTSLSIFIRTDATATEVQLIATKRDIVRTSCVRYVSYWRSSVQVG